MNITDDFPHPVREIENHWIPLADGCRLAARLWLPADAGPAPAIVEYIPYRKRDGTRERDEPMHAWFAGHGYAAIRIDLRGSGDSDGLLSDEYTPQEQSDGVEALAWIAAQSWCNGRVGLIGKSWGGFNALQIAARQPPSLKAVISVCASDDRYADDAHYMGGCLLTENLTWGSVLFTINALPPDPLLVGDRWREMWLERLQNNPLFPELWLRHPLRDDYWRQGSVCEDYAAIQCPVYAIGGWADAYSNAVPRLLANLKAPAKGLVGPWGHVYPQDGVPGPAIGFLQEALRWWDCWLKGQDTGVRQERAFRVWMQDPVAPAGQQAQRPGRWVAEACWPSPRVKDRRWYLGPDQLLDEPGAAEVLEHHPLQTIGQCAGDWCAFGGEGEMPLDQRPDDACSLVFDSAVLAKDLEVLGAPTVRLRLASDQSGGFIAVRLSLIGRDGAVSRISYGLLNLTRRNGPDSNAALVPGQFEDVTLRLNDLAQRVPAGTRLRVAISSAYWPMVWPSAVPAVISLDTSGCHLDLPLRPPDAADAQLRAFEAPVAAPPLRQSVVRGGQSRRLIQLDPVSGELLYKLHLDQDEQGEPGLAHVPDIDLTIGHAIEESYRIRPHDPLSAEATMVHKTHSQRGDWSTRVETRMRMRASLDAFELSVRLRAYEGDEQVFDRRWKRRIPRQGV